MKGDLGNILFTVYTQIEVGETGWEHFQEISSFNECHWKNMKVEWSLVLGFLAVLLLPGSSEPLAQKSLCEPWAAESAKPWNRTPSYTACFVSYPSGCSPWLCQASLVCMPVCSLCLSMALVSLYQDHLFAHLYLPFKPGIPWGHELLILCLLYILYLAQCPVLGWSWSLNICSVSDWDLKDHLIPLNLFFPLLN